MGNMNTSLFVFFWPLLDSILVSVVFFLTVIWIPVHLAFIAASPFVSLVPHSSPRAGRARLARGRGRARPGGARQGRVRGRGRRAGSREGGHGAPPREERAFRRGGALSRLPPGGRRARGRPPRALPAGRGGVGGAPARAAPPGGRLRGRRGLGRRPG